MADLTLVEKPIIILGSARAGTTMLCTLLGQHPELALSVEPRLIWRYGNDRGSDMLKRSAATPRVKKHIRETFADFVQSQGKARLLEKSPSNALRPGFVHEVFPDARFIHVMRHGLDSVLSIQDMTTRHAHGLTGLAKGRLKQRLSELQITRAHHYALEFARRAAPGFLRPIVGQNPWGPRIPGIQAMMRELDPLELSALQWRMCVETTHRFRNEVPDDQFFEFKLEAFDRDTLQAVLRFCGLDNNEPVLEHFDKTFKPSYASRQRKEADPRVIDQIMAYIEPTLDWLGYETDSVKPR
jgi:hypothetical protein